MPQDFYQIGSWLVSKDLVSLLGQIMGTIIGGLIAYFTVKASEKQRWAQEKSEKLQEQYREAIVIALDWIDPYRDAVSQAQQIIADYVMGRIDDEQYVMLWPKLIGHPLLKDPPKRLRILLPKDLYPRFFSILTKLEQVETAPLYHRRGTEEFGDSYNYTRKVFKELEEQIDQLEEDLVKEYKNTFKPNL